MGKGLSAGFLPFSPASWPVKADRKAKPANNNREKQVTEWNSIFRRMTAYLLVKDWGGEMAGSSIIVSRSFNRNKRPTTTGQDCLVTRSEIFSGTKKCSELARQGPK